MNMRATCLAAVLLTASCGNSPGVSDGYDAFFALLRERTGPAPETRPLTRADIAGFTDPLLYAALPEREVEALLGLARRNGTTETWMTPDDIALILRDGVLVGTRGLGEDLMSAAVPRIRLSGAASPRSAFHIAGDVETVRTDFNCVIAPGVSDSVTILGETRRLTRVAERCTGPSGDFENLYWFDAAGTIRASRQWVSTSVGYITLQRLID